MGSLSNISIASLKNSIDEVRAQVYPRNETEKKVCFSSTMSVLNVYLFSSIVCPCQITGLRSFIIEELGCLNNTNERYRR